MIFGFRSAHRAAFVFIALWLWAPSTVGAETLTIGGTGGDLGTIRQLGAAFEKTAAGEGVTVNVLDSLGSGGGIRAAKASVLEIAISSRTLKDKERAPGLKIFAYAKTAMVIVANNTHGLSGISAAELARIYRGETRNWPDGTAYRIVLRPKGDTDTQIVKNQLAEMADALDAAAMRRGIPIGRSDQHAADLIERLPGSIGILALSVVLGEKRPLEVIDLERVSPSTRNIANGQYKLLKTFYMITTPRSGQAARKFIAFMRSKNGREILERTGHVAIEPRG